MRDTLTKVAKVIERQRATGDELRSALDAALSAGHTWREIGQAAGVPFQTLQRQYAKGGPIVLQVGGAR